MIVAGEMVAVEFPGQPARYERADKPHQHHFFCDYCGRVFDLPGCVAGMLSLLPEEFRPTKHELAIYGPYRGCAIAGAKERDPKTHS